MNTCRLQKGLGTETLCRGFLYRLSEEQDYMKKIQADFRYVDEMLGERRKNRQMGRITPCDFSELYLYVLHYWRVYWQLDEKREDSLLYLAAEIEYMYNALYPDEPPIEQNRNIRNAGRPKKYDEEFENNVMKLLQEGYGPTEIAAQVGCAKSTVSKLNRKRKIRR